MASGKAGREDNSQVRERFETLISRRPNNNYLAECRKATERLLKTVFMDIIPQTILWVVPHIIQRQT